jgi:Ca2+-binding EF-hand superfamily protein
MKKSKVFLGLGLASALALPAIAAAWPDGEGRRAKMIEKFDANKDGALDDAERKVMHERREAMRAERRAQMLAEYDADKDGALDDAELAKAKLDRATKRFQALDTNKDNVLSFEEFAAGRERMMGKRHRGGSF